MATLRWTAFSFHLVLRFASLALQSCLLIASSSTAFDGVFALVNPPASDGLGRHAGIVVAQRVRSAYFDSCESSAALRSRMVGTGRTSRTGRAGRADRADTAGRAEEEGQVDQDEV